MGISTHVTGIRSLDGEFRNVEKPVIMLDFDGCIASQGKIWEEEPKIGISEKPPWTAERISGPGNLSVQKVISDHDSWAIDHFKEHAHIVIISGDNRINEAWAKRRGVPFIFTAAKGFHQDKWNYLLEYWLENFPDISSPKGNYYYLGDAMPDWKCLENSKCGFVPYDASKFIVSKIGKYNHLTWLEVKSGQGCFENMAAILVENGVLPSV